MRIRILLAVGFLSACAAPPPPSARVIPTVPGGPAAAVATAPAPPEEAPEEAREPRREETREYVLSGSSLKLPDRSTVKRDGDHFVFHAMLPEGESSTYSYIEPGNAQLMHEAWMFTRDESTGTARVRLWTPRTVDMHGRNATLGLGDRVVAGDWKIEWVGVISGSGDETGKRVLWLRSVHGGRATHYWQYDGTTPAKHDFPTSDGQHHFQVSVASVKLTPDARDSTLVLRGQEVDLAKKGSLGAPIAEGLWVYPDGLRIRYERQTVCGMGKVCTCFTSYLVTSGGTSVHVPEAGSAHAFGHDLTRAGNEIVVRR